MANLTRGDLRWLSLLNVFIIGGYSCATIFLVFAITPKPADAVQTNECSENAAFKIRNLRVVPAQVKLGENISISWELEVGRDVAGPISMVADVKKATDFLGQQLDLQVPCIRNKWGSCAIDDMCPLFDCKRFGDGVPCGCPVRRGLYKSLNVQYPIPVVQPDFEKYAKGKVIGQFSFKDGIGQDLGCVAANFTII